MTVWTILAVILVIAVLAGDDWLRKAADKNNRERRKRNRDFRR